MGSRGRSGHGKKCNRLTTAIWSRTVEITAFEDQTSRRTCPVWRESWEHGYFTRSALEETASDSKSSDEQGAIRRTAVKWPIICHKAPYPSLLEVVPAEGLEPPLPCENQILSLARLPFRHAGKCP